MVEQYPQIFCELRSIFPRPELIVERSFDLLVIIFFMIKWRLLTYMCNMLNFRNSGLG